LPLEANIRVCASIEGGPTPSRTTARSRVGSSSGSPRPASRRSGSGSPTGRSRSGGATPGPTGTTAPADVALDGRAVAYTGSTVAFARVLPIDDPRSGLGDRYDAAIAALLDALAELAVDATEGEPPDAFCPGTHSLQATAGGRARKLAGLAQRVHDDAAVVAGVVLVADHGAVAEVLEPVYDALGVVFDPGTVGSVALAGGSDDPAVVAAAIEDALVGDREATVETVEPDAA